MYVRDKEGKGKREGKGEGKGKGEEKEKERQFRTAISLQAAIPTGPHRGGADSGDRVDLQGRRRNERPMGGYSVRSRNFTRIS
jgi:hypothetical protein